MTFPTQREKAKFQKTEDVVGENPVGNLFYEAKGPGVSVQR